MRVGDLDRAFKHGASHSVGPISFFSLNKHDSRFRKNPAYIMVMPGDDWVWLPLLQYRDANKVPVVASNKFCCHLIAIALRRGFFPVEVV